MTDEERTRLERLERIAKLAQNVRDAQKRYFRDLVASKELERQLDDALAPPGLFG